MVLGEVVRAARTTAVPFADCWITPAAREAAGRVLASGWVTSGPEVGLFEAEFADTVGASHAVAVSSCTAGIELALRSLHLPDQAAVLTSTLTFCGAVQAILHAGLRPVLVDVDAMTGLPTTETVERAAGTVRPEAMVVVHWAGDPVDTASLAAAAGLPPERIVEDAAHAVGTSWRGEPVGTGSAVCFSFYATKNLPIGEGGMITTDDPDRADWMRSARLHGMTADAWRRYLPGGGWRYDVEEAGLKANLTDLQAAIGREQLHALPDWQRRRGDIARRYDAGLAGVPAVGLPHRPRAEDGVHAWHLYPIRVADGLRDHVQAELAGKEIATSVHFIPVHRLSWFRVSCTLPAGGLPGADRLFDQLLSLPMYPRLRDDQVDAVCEAVAAALGTSPHRGETCPSL
ncbi:MAG TPA: DegT/DnrJ/EryC1/StrS aminotransferase family protein [Nocardioides sp.]|uniref:DegT/DnrJ/EryC1/StrS family aminotransferase n=1 Tax=Nocardioides sp. TaxID=35761 RepID=UPI002F418F85